MDLPELARTYQTGGPVDAACTVEDAIQHACWYTRYAIDRLGNDGRQYHPGVRSHLIATRTHVDTAADLATPPCDQVRVTADKALDGEAIDQEVGLTTTRDGQW